MKTVVPTFTTSGYVVDNVNKAQKALQYFLKVPKSVSNTYTSVASLSDILARNVGTEDLITDEVDDKLSEYLDKIFPGGIELTVSMEELMDGELELKIRIIIPNDNGGDTVVGSDIVFDGSVINKIANWSRVP